MWSKNAAFGIFLTLLAHHQATSQDYGECTNPRGQEGRCIPIRSCEPLITFLKQTNGREGTQFLRESVCVFEGNNPIVCCPDEFDYNDNSNFDNNNNNNNNNYPNPNTNGDQFSTNPPSATRYGPLYPPVCGYTDAKFTRVVNGVPASLGAWPWAALLGYRSKRNPSKPNFKCGGTLISARHILTAAHCVQGFNDLYLVRVGELDLDDENEGATPIDLFIERKTVHPKYDAKSVSNDIAILKVDRDIQFTDLIKPICLPVTEDIQRQNLNNAWPYIVGWGSLGYRRASSAILQQVQLPIVQQDQCKAAYVGKGVFIDERVLCAGYAQGGKDACQGDSGGPMMYRIGKAWYSLGIISFGVNCALPGYPGVYTKTQSFLNFILQNLN